MLPPITIVEGVGIDFNIHFKVMFGEFVQTYEGVDNTMTPRTVDALALGHVNDWKKIKHLLGCTWNTRRLPLIIVID